MKLNMKSLLKDKNVLYVVFFIAALNFLGYLISYNLDAVVFFLIVGYLSTYFSKNMIIVLIVAMIATNLLVATNSMNSFKEGMKVKQKAEKIISNTKKKATSGFNNPTVSAPAGLDEEEGSGKKSNLDYAGTIEAAYDNIDKLLGSDAIRNMSEDTQRLAEKQKNLMGNIKQLEPLMQRAGSMLEGLEGGKLEGMIENLSKRIGGLKVGKKTE